MGENKSELGLLVYIIPFLAIVPVMHSQGWDSSESAILIVAVPFVTFPVILVAGQIYNGHETWKDKLKEGGILALGALDMDPYLQKGGLGTGGSGTPILA